MKKVIEGLAVIAIIGLISAKIISVGQDVKDIAVNMNNTYMQELVELDSEL